MHSHGGHSGQHRMPRPATDSSNNAPLNKVQSGPKTSMTQECSAHKGFNIIFKGTTEGELCEKCFAERAKTKSDARNQQQESVSALASDDLLDRLKGPARPL
jgi:hypothetical protein